MSESPMTLTHVPLRTLLAAAMLASLMSIDMAAQAPVAAPPPPGPVKRMPDGRPDFNGFFQTDAGGANWGFEAHKEAFTPGGRGVIIDPPDLKLPYQPWAQQEKASRTRPERGYDDPTAHCFVAGVPRSLYVPAPVHIFQTPEAIVFLHERMAWRTVYLDRKTHLPDTIRLWQGDSIGHWEGDTLVVETKNLNGKTWLNEVGDVISHAATVVERFTPVNANRIDYRATVTDPNVYTRPCTIQLPINRQPGEMLEVACLEDNQDLKHLKEVRDEARAKAAAEGAK